MKSENSGLEVLQNLRVILVEPLGSANIGSVARAMKNFGLNDLVLVRPQVPHCNGQARAMAVKAVPLLRHARVVADLDEGLKGCSWAIGFTALEMKRSEDQRDYSEVLPEAVDFLRLNKKVAFVFGREDNGLDHHCMDRCRYLVRFKTHPQYSSLNLAQAALLATAGAFQEVDKASGQNIIRTQTYAQADCSEREDFYRDFESLLFEIGFLRDDTAPTTMRKFRRLFERSQMNEQEVSLFRGLCRQLRWAKKTRKIPELP